MHAAERHRGQLQRTASIICSCWVLATPHAATALEPRSLADLTLEQLSASEVTSVSRREEPLADAAAPIFVITAGDIRRALTPRNLFDRRHAEFTTASRCERAALASVLLRL